MTATDDRDPAAAEAAVAALVARRPAYAVDATQPAYRGGTNRVTLGSDAGRPVVFKYYFREWRWRNELFCLRHFAPTGNVPAVVDVVPPSLLVLARLPGSDLDVTGLDQTQVAALSRGIGQALASLTGTPLPDDDLALDGVRRPHDFDRLSWDQDRRAVVEGLLARCHRIQRDIPAFGDPFLARSLALLDRQVATLDGQRGVLFHEDIANLRHVGPRFVGFYDLEMCRRGSEAMQLGVALGLCGPGGLDWPALAAGYGERTGVRLTADDTRAALAMHHLYHWIRICHWGEWDGDLGATARRRAAEAQAGEHIQAMRAACQVARESASLSPWFDDA